MDKIIINGFSYPITDSINELPIKIAKEINELIPAKSWYRNPKEKEYYSNELAIELLSLICGIPAEILEKCENVEHIYFAFIHQLIFQLYNPIEVEILNFRDYHFIIDKYENGMIHPFAEACDLLTDGKSIEMADYLLAIYLRPKDEIYSEKKAKERVKEFERWTYNNFVAVLIEHNKAVADVRKYHPKIFEGTGKETKSMSGLISMVAEKGVFNKAGLTPLESARQVLVSEFFDYVETLI